jgi:iron complex transport system ATP-binding protein
MSEILHLDKLSFAYRDTPVLQDVTLSLSEGEILALLGPNGSGKSTLIRAAMGQLRGNGDIAWQGRRIRSWSRRGLAKVVAYLPQTPTYEPSARVIDVLRLGRSAYWGAFGIEAPGDASVIDEVATTLNLNDLLTRRMDELSGGQRQRAFIGRCLVQQPVAMLLDEPSTFLDLKAQVELCQLLRKLATEQKIAVLMASHDLNLTATFADRICLLSQGAVVASGRPVEVLIEETLTRTYGLSMQRIDRDGLAPLVVPKL